MMRLTFQLNQTAQHYSGFKNGLSINQPVQLLRLYFISSPSGFGSARNRRVNFANIKDLIKMIFPGNGNFLLDHAKH